jgi:transposase-like protein
VCALSWLQLRPLTWCTGNGAEAQTRCGVEYGELSPERVNFRNAAGRGEMDTGVGTMELAVPALAGARMRLYRRRT